MPMENENGSSRMKPQKLARMIGKASRYVNPAKRGSYTKYAFQYASSHNDLDEETLYSHLVAIALRW